MFGCSCTYERPNPEQGVGGEPVSSRMVEPLDSCDQPDASFLEQFRIGKLATRRKLSTDHPYKPHVGSDESLPCQRSLVFEQSQLLIRRIGETGA